MRGMWGSCTPLLIGSRSSLAYLKLGVIVQARSANAKFILACYISLNLTILRMAAKRHQSVKSTRRTWNAKRTGKPCVPKRTCRTWNAKRTCKSCDAKRTCKSRDPKRTTNAKRTHKACTTHLQFRPCQRHVQITLLFWQDNTILLEVRLCSLAESEPPSHEHFKDCSVLCNEPSSTSADVCEATDKSPGLPETVSSKT